MTFLDRLFGARHSCKHGSETAKHALAISSDLIKQMQERSQSHDAARAVMADIWAQRHNIPYLTTVYEANEEMQSGMGRNATNDNDES